MNLGKKENSGQLNNVVRELLADKYCFRRLVEMQDSKNNNIVVAWRTSYINEAITNAAACSSSFGATSQFVGGFRAVATSISDKCVQASGRGGAVRDTSSLTWL